MDRGKGKPLQPDPVFQQAGPDGGGRHGADVRETAVEFRRIELADLSGNGFADGGKDDLVNTRVEILLRERSAIASHQFREKPLRIGNGEGKAAGSKRLHGKTEAMLTEGDLPHSHT